MVAPLKIGARVEIDATQAVQGGAASAAAVDSIGNAAVQTTEKLRKLDQAASGAAIRAPDWSQKIKAMGAEGKAIDDLRAKYNPLYATMRSYRQEVAGIKAAHAAGSLSIDEMTAAISRQRRETLATTAALKAKNNPLRPPPSNNNNPSGLRTDQKTNLFAQGTDVVQSLALGMPIQQVILQQAGQILGIFGSIEEARKALFAGFSLLLRPVSLIAIGVAAAGYATYRYFTSASRDIKNLDDALENHKKTIERLEAAYGGVITSARNYARENRTILEATSRQALSDLLGTSKAENTNFLNTIELSGLITGGGKLVGLEKQFEPFRTEIMKLRDQAKAGKPDFDAFLASIEKTAETDPKYLKAADELALLVENAKRANDAIAELRRTEMARAAGQRGFLVNSQAQNDFGDYTDQQNKSLRDQRKRYEAGIANMNARSPAEQAAAARLDASLEDDGNGGEVQKQRVRIAGRLALAQAEKQLHDAQLERRRSLEASVEQQQLELSLFGKTISEQERLRMEYQLTSELKADALRNGIAVDERELAIIKEKAAAYGRLAEQIAAQKALQDADRELAKLQMELSLIGQSETVRSRILRQMETENRIRDLGLAQGSAEAEQLRQKSVLASQVTDQINKQEAALGKVRDTAESTFDTIFDAAQSGDWDSVLGDIAKDWSKTLFEMGAKNPAKNAALGTSLPTIDDAGGIGSIVSALFGGGAGDVSAMTVTAGTVVVNGGIGAGAGIPGLTAPANDNSSFANPTGAATRAALPAAGVTKTGIPLSEISAASGLTAKVSSAYAPRFQGLFNDLKAAGYKISSLGEGGYSYRNVSGTNNLSKHAFGEAIDINPRQNPWSHKFQTDLPANVNELAKKNGLTWGGTWSKPDTMHFQVDKSANTAALALNKMANNAGAATEGLGALGGGMNQLGNALSQFPAAPAAGGGGGGLFGWLGKLFGGGTLPSVFSGSGQAALAFANPGMGLYANGGISDRPAIFGEGPMVEAAVPLPNGRSIPVDMRMTQAMPRTAPYVSNGLSAANANAPRSTVIIKNYAGVQVDHEETTDERGGRQSEFTISDAVGAALAKKGGGGAKTLKRVYGISPKRIQR